MELSQASDYARKMMNVFKKYNKLFVEVLIWDQVECLTER